MKFEIKNRFSGELIIAVEADSWRMAVELAIKQKADLSYANLSSANLRSANLISADLSSANLSSADLSSANLSYADLSSANLSSANLRSANLISADLSSANLSYADLSSANLSYADLMIFQYQNSWAHYTFDGMLRIGCEFHKVETWLKEYKEIGKKHGYSDLQIKMYGYFIKQCALHNIRS